jgi:hypothetical protein
MSISHRATFLIAVGAPALIAGLLTGCSGGDKTSRQDEVAIRGATVMPFDLSKTHHTFEQTAAGGVESVRALDARDTAQIALIRSHLQSEAAKFASGDFADPMTIHGQTMPGVGALSAAGARLRIEYAELTDGAKIVYSSDDPVIVAAVHDWFTAQLSDHGQHASAQ